MKDSALRLLKNPRLWQAALGIYWLALFAGTHVPVSLPLPPENGADKVVHFTAYAVLAALIAITWQLSAGHLTARHLVAIWLVVVAYGALDEWTQGMVGRDCSAWDSLADALGAGTGLVLFAALRDKFRRSAS